MLEPGAKTLEQQSNTVWAQRLKLLCLLLLKGQLINEMEILLSELSGQRICPVLGKERKKRKITSLGVITGASRPRGSPRLLP